MHKQKTKAFVRGGQLFLYNARMFVQVASRIAKWAVLLYLLIVLLMMFCLTNWIDIKEIGMQIYCLTLSFFGFSSSQAWVSSHDPSIFFTAGSFLNDPVQQGIVSDSYGVFMRHLWISGISSIFIYFGATRLFTNYFIKSGNKHSDDQIISGTKLAKSIKNTLYSLKKSSKGLSDIKIANVLPLPRFSEFQGILYHGSTGAGKTQGIMRLLDEIRAAGDPVIIYDKECALKPYFFRSGIDVELNPISSLCAHWDIWRECETPIEMAALAVYLMPKSVQGSDPFWVDAARTIFSTVAWEMRNDSNRSVIRLLQALLTTSLEELRGILSGTEAENLVSKDIEKTAISIRAVLATYTKSLRFLEGLEPLNESDSFSIKHWVKSQFTSENPTKSWLFISSRSQFHKEIKPLISAWIGMSMRGIQSLEPNTNRRFWIVMDEMASLNRLEDFSEVSADIRKFGGCLAVGVQSFSQLEFIYGSHEATAITDLLNTSVYYRSPKERVAEWVSKDLGSQEIDEVKESQSYGPDSIRDGNTIGRQRVTRRTVDASKIMQLEDLNFFVRLVGEHPITQIHSPYIKDRVKILSQDLIERVIDWDAIKKLTAAANAAETDPNRANGVKIEQMSNEKNEKASDEDALSDLLDVHNQEIQSVMIRE